MKTLDSDYFSEVRAEYEKLLNSIGHLSYSELVQELERNLPFLWTDFYESQSERLCNIFVIRRGGFEYLFDEIDSFIAQGILPDEANLSSRIVAAYGKSAPKISKRDDYRLRGWVGPTEKIFGKDWDKGHFIAHSIGGAVEGTELNVFKQKRELNRGWSEEGKLFRKMEEFCFQNPGTFCYNRPLYNDQSDCPSVIEFGLLKPNNELWVEFFDNQ
ncbi:MAG: hypothetical protein ACERKD_03060 [Prolixibacteraceae bacterium]